MDTAKKHNPSGGNSKWKDLSRHLPSVFEGQQRGKCGRRLVNKEKSSSQRQRAVPGGQIPQAIMMIVFFLPGKIGSHERVLSRERT